jgi:Ca2+-binding RTX toxin-like protein
MRGGRGDDTYYVDNAGDVVVDVSGGGTDSVRSSVTFALSSYVERLVLTGSADIDGYGNGLANRMTGNSGDNALNGNTGADRMEGLGGNDTYYVDNQNDRVVEGANDGLDTVRSTISYTLGAHAERLVLIGSADIYGLGNSLANRISGNSGENIINGREGKDTLTGGGDVDGFRFNTALGSNNYDTITDFQINVDEIQLENAIFTAVGSSLTPSEFVANASGAATNSLQHIIYDTTDGRLYYDVDGSGAQGRVRFATLDAGLALDNQDFLVI